MIGGALERARCLAAAGDDEAARQAYLDLVILDPAHPAALTELGELARSGGYMAAARQAYRHAVQCHPQDTTARVGYADLLCEASDPLTACEHYHAALAIDAALPRAHQGLARALSSLGRDAGAHWTRGFEGHAVVTRRFRGQGAGVKLLLLVSATGGNVATRQWIDDRIYAVTAVYADFFNPDDPVPPNALIVNAIGDADLCRTALVNAERMTARCTVPVINPPALVRATGRENIARRLAALPGIIAPRIAPLSGASLNFPVLLRAPGYHTGQHFVQVQTEDALAAAAASLPGAGLLAIEYLDARGPDGMARKYRVMFIDGVAYPLHLAISADWKVHYYTAAMATEPAFRAEERRFLDDMPATLGQRATAALCQVQAALGLDYAGIDFALAADGSLLLFEANATMVINPPDPDPIWDYRRPAAAAALGAARRMLARRVRQPEQERRFAVDAPAVNHVDFADALSQHEQGHVAAAASLYRAILARDPDHADSLHLLGLITTDAGDPIAGMALIRRAMALQSDRAPYYNSLGHAYRLLGQAQEAVAAYRQAAALRPGSPEIHNNLATVLYELGEQGEAIVHYRRALAAAPGLADIWYNLANALSEVGTLTQLAAPFPTMPLYQNGAGSQTKPSHQPDGASRTEDRPRPETSPHDEVTPSVEVEFCYQNAIRLRPDFVAAHGNYGRWLMTNGRWAEAGARLVDAILLAPTQAANWNNLGIVRRESGSPEAEMCFRRALAIDPNFADAHYNLGCLLFGDGRTEEALACHQASLAANNQSGIARLAACMAQLPILYRSEQEIVVCRQRYTASLCDLGTTDLAEAVGSSQPFFLPYQGEDDRSLQAAYGHLVCKALAEPAAPLAPPPARGQRIRLGIVSGFFCDHTLFKLFLEGWLTRLDRTRFEILLFHTGHVSDAFTARCAALCDGFVHGTSSDAAWRDAIVSAAPHVLLYPEVGIDPIAGRLAAQRLAPVQCATWGQPETTGMPTIDAFLSSDLMEPPDSDNYYTERLVRLPNLGLCYLPDALSPPYHDRAALGLAQDVPVFWSGQALYKYLPRYDVIFPRIAAALGRCRFVFIAFANSRAVTEIFRQRLWTAFAAAGLDAEAYVVILPPMTQADYLAAVGMADVILDTPGWSGGKSTMDCLLWDPAIVTLPGRFMRGRHTAAILRRIGCEATIAASVDDYISIAIRLARDPVWRAEVRQAVKRGKHRAFDDRAYIRALEDFLSGAVFASG